jgi:PAS domain S-box-containing protein
MPYYTEVVKALVTAAALGAGAWLVKQIKCMITTLRKVETALPTLLQVAEEMKPNGGNSLRDRVDKISKQLLYQDGARRLSYDLPPEGAFYECDDNGGYVYVNRQWTRLTGLSYEDSLGDGWLSGVHPDDRPTVAEEWWDCIKHRREFDLSFRLVSHDDVVTKVNSHARVLKDNSGALIGFIGVNTIIKEAPCSTQLGLPLS